ncbi:hypothetical protein FB556_2131 [Enteractinococcus coprophilus]|uniref:Lipoprotein n=1 Tax=Enteractinococcus coprophilus TaxID=1027633 RepID=A0A543AGE0_9MICC|nr:hypothetical protein FB556_2131 [Enteractinococcus coprophilus]
MKHSLSTLAAVALITLTGCSSDDTEAISATPPPAPIEAANQPSNALQPNPDGYEMRVMYQWIPELPSIKPAEVRLKIQIQDQAHGTRELYITPASSHEQMPSIDSGQYLIKDFQVPAGGTFTAQGSVSNPPNEGRLTCLVVELEQQVVLDYQETSAGSNESLSCIGFTHDEHDYKTGPARPLSVSPPHTN